MLCFPDVNECDRQNGGCEHECVNEVGSHHCLCPDGYVLTDDHHTCKGITMDFVCKHPRYPSLVLCVSLFAGIMCVIRPQNLECCDTVKTDVSYVYIFVFQSL